jgi:hypothetical protein
LYFPSTFLYFSRISFKFPSKIISFLFPSFCQKILSKGNFLQNGSTAPRGMNGRFRKLAEAGLGRAKVGCGLFWNNECFIRAIIKIFSFGDCRVE